MGRLGTPLLALLPFAACAVPVPDYCDAETPCGEPLALCLLPEHACAPALAWGELSGAQAVPPTPSDVTGSLRIGRNDRGGLVYNLSFARGLPNRGRRDLAVLAVHLHPGRPGEVNQPIATLSPSIGELALADDSLGLLSGAYYADVKTEAFPAGEVRAQIWPLAPAPARVPLLAALSPWQEGEERDSRGHGLATALLDAGSGAIEYAVRIEDVRTPVGNMHFHRAPFGIAGPTVVDLAVPMAPAGMVSGTVAGEKLPAPYPQLMPILLRAGLIYVNVHTQQYPSGELRGQLLPDEEHGATPFHAVLTPDNVTPKVSSAATGLGSFVLSADGRQLTYLVTHTVVDATGLRFSREGAAVGVLDLGPAGFQGTLAVTAGGGETSLSEIDLRAGLLSLSVLSEAHPDGVIRGRLQLPQYRQ